MVTPIVHYKGLKGFVLKLKIKSCYKGSDQSLAKNRIRGSVPRTKKDF